MEFLIDEGILYPKKKRLWVSFIFNRLSLYISEKQICKDAYMYSWVNFLLMLCFFPVLVTGLALFYIAKQGEIYDFSMFYAGLIFGMTMGILLHECGHYIAARAFRARIFEAGLMLLLFIIPGAYVQLDMSNIKSRWKKFQIYAAGCETNLLLGGLFFIIASLTKTLDGFWMIAALTNVILGVVNLSFFENLDGSYLVSQLFGVDEIFEEILDDEKKSTKKCKDCGVNTYMLRILKRILQFYRIGILFVLLSQVLQFFI